MDFNIGDIIYFYYDSSIICQKGRVIGYSNYPYPAYYKVKWIDKFHEVGESYIVAFRVFKDMQSCLTYSENLSKDYKTEIRSKINTQKELLQYMYDCIYEDDYDYCDEKAVIREKCKELFNIEIGETNER